MQVEHVDFVETLHQAPAHPPEGGIVQVGVVGDHPHHAAARAPLDLPLGEAEELDIIVLKPLRVALVDGPSVHLLVGLDLLEDPLAVVA